MTAATIVLIALYFVPTVIASSRGHLSTGAVFALNLLLGWTALGWIVALIWSLTGNTQRTFVQHVAQPNLPKPDGIGRFVEPRRPKAASAVPEVVLASPPPTIIYQSGPGSYKSKFVAGLLALFLGGLGIHKFYLNQPVAGIFYFLFCWTFIPALISFFEAFGYWFMSDASFAQKYCPPMTLVLSGPPSA